MMTISCTFWILCTLSIAKYLLQIHRKILKQTYVFLVCVPPGLKTQNHYWLTFSQKIFDIRYLEIIIVWNDVCFFEDVLQIVLNLGLVINGVMKFVIIVNVNLMEVIVSVIFYFFFLNKFLWQGVNLFQKTKKRKVSSSLRKWFKVFKILQSFDFCMNFKNGNTQKKNTKGLDDSTANLIFGEIHLNSIHSLTVHACFAEKENILAIFPDKSLFVFCREIENQTH